MTIPSTLPTISPSSVNLADYQWQNRLLLVFAPSAESSEYQTQLQALEAEADGFRDRDLLLIPVLTEEDTAATETTDEAIAAQMHEAVAAQLRDQFSVDAEEFAVILMGKDGTEKRRDHTPTEPSAIFQQIDGMPMRQREMRDRQ